MTTTALGFCVWCDQAIARDGAGSWWHVETRFIQCSGNADEDFSQASPGVGVLYAVEPTPAVARRVLDRVTVVLRDGGVTALPNEFSELAREFGVQESQGSES